MSCRRVYCRTVIKYMENIVIFLTPMVIAAAALIFGVVAGFLFRRLLTEKRWRELTPRAGS